MKCILITKKAKELSKDKAARWELTKAFVRYQKDMPVEDSKYYVCWVGSDGVMRIYATVERFNDIREYDEYDRSRS